MEPPIAPDEIRQRIVAEALSWQKTPYHDHAGIKNVGVDCAYFPLRVMQAVGIIPPDVVPPYYSPQAWLNKVEDTTYIEMLLRFAKETQEQEVRPGDLVLYKIVRSWTHGAIVIEWPRYLLHPLAGRGIIASGANDGVLHRRPRRFFSFL